LLRKTSLFTLLWLSLGVAHSQAQDVRYISDTQYIPLRSGAGSEYRILNSGLPSGTRLTVHETSADGLWARITTAGGESGWLRAQYLMQEQPAESRLQEVAARNRQLETQNATLSEQLQALQAERGELATRVSETGSNLEQISEELAQLKQISGNAVQLDADNRRLAEVSERLRAEVDTLEAENHRLQDELKSSAFIDGALAVLLGVIITLVAPRLWPKPRRSSSWA
jgi:SH3 domain protein